MSGYVKRYRSIDDHPVLANSKNEKYDKVHAFEWMISSANYKTRKVRFNGELITLEPGQFITSQRKMAAQFNWSKTTVKSFLDLLQANDMISYKTIQRQGTLLTVENYTRWQVSRDTRWDTGWDTRWPQTKNKKEIKKASPSEDGPLNDEIGGVFDWT